MNKYWKDISRNIGARKEVIISHIRHINLMLKLQSDLQELIFQKIVVKYCNQNRKYIFMK